MGNAKHTFIIMKPRVSSTPKLYLFRNEEEARLIVGSNNITEAGLYVNVEAGLQTDVAVDSPIIVQVLEALASWKDTASRLAFRLDPALLQRLVNEGYVPDEATARAQLRQDAALPPLDHPFSAQEVSRRRLTWEPHGLRLPGRQFFGNPPSH